MATDTRIFPDQNINNTKNSEINRVEIQAAIAKAVELRALHAALVQGSSPANLRFPSSASPAKSRHASHFSAQDYPVFTPSYEDEPTSGYLQNPMKNRTLSESWNDYGIEENGDESVVSNYKENSSSRKGFPSDLSNFESHICPAEDNKSVTSSCANNITVLQTSPDSHVSTTQSQPKSRGVMSWLFPRLKKKHKNGSSPTRTESEEVSQVYKDFGITSVEVLKKELIQANENRDSALKEVSEMRSSLGELKQKLEYLETYCEELKKALRQATHANKNFQMPEIIGNLPNRPGKSSNGIAENLMPVSEEVMVEGFLQIVSEARLSARQFCKILVAQIELTDNTLVDNLNVLLQPFKLSLNSKYSKAVSYHLEAIINQSLYQDFENCVFQKHGSPKLLDPQQARQAQFSSFVALRNLSWNEVLRKGTKYYCEEFSKFCDQKMSCIITTLNWTRSWPEQVLQAFFVATKCIWLLHLLAFSFYPPLGILRVEENRSFDPHYMEDMFIDRQRSHGSSRVKIMVMPGFYVQDRVLRCKVLCRYKSAGAN
ncbi:IRK-interacting protein isoform X2 [Argentina anserina]|uniref:IRK-interacting protein isoform X2 n=1 Tax=Argentina anserina TaxID=57926 RepID=UPI0021762AAA|nr:IRK-interacting protein isoform X2 [Potentilla anserina]